MKYEYKTVRVPKAAQSFFASAKSRTRKRDQMLSQYGAQGWEVEQIRSGFGHTEEVVLRRARLVEALPLERFVPESNLETRNICMCYCSEIGVDLGAGPAATLIEVD